MNYELIENLNENQIKELYNDIVENNEIISINCTTSQTWYVRCANGTTNKRLKSRTNWSCDSQYLCRYGNMVKNGCNEITIDVCGSANSGECCLNS